MRQVKPNGPCIHGEKLYGGGPAPLPVGGPEWYGWLGEARTFYWRPVREGQEWYRARREVRRGQAYWYVACRVGGRVQRFYLGAAGGLDVARLASVAAEIAAARAESSHGALPGEEVRQSQRPATA